MVPKFEYELNIVDTLKSENFKSQYTDEVIASGAVPCIVDNATTVFGEINVLVKYLAQKN